MTFPHIIGFAVAALLACAAPSSGTESTVAPAPKNLADTVPLYTNLGAHHKRISTRVPATQQYFDQGLRLVYGFNHAEAIRSFTRAAALDPTCAMCYWGIALAYGPHVNAPMDTASGVAAYAAAQKALALTSHATAPERAYIEAVVQRYEAVPPTERARLDTAVFARDGAGCHHLPQGPRRRDPVRRIADGPPPVELLATRRDALPRHDGNRTTARESDLTATRTTPARAITTSTRSKR